MTERPQLPLGPRKSPESDPPELRALLRAGGWLKASWAWVASRPTRLQAMIALVSVFVFLMLVGMVQRGSEQQATKATVKSTPQSQQSTAGIKAADLMDQVRARMGSAPVLEVRSLSPRATATLGDGRAIIRPASGPAYGVDADGVGWVKNGSCWVQGPEREPIGLTDLLPMVYASDTRFTEPGAEKDVTVKYRASSFGDFDAGSGEIRIDSEGRLTSVTFKEQSTGQGQDLEVIWPASGARPPVFEPQCATSGRRTGQAGQAEPAGR